MSIVRWSPMWDPFAELDEMRLPALNNMARAFVPAVDIYDTAKAVVVETALPGVDPNEVKVVVEKGVLTISGEHKKEREVEEKNYYRKEVRSGSFYREVVLPTAVLESEVEAVFADGMLKITCPKSDKAESTQINVKVVNKNK